MSDLVLSGRTHEGRPTYYGPLSAAPVGSLFRLPLNPAVWDRVVRDERSYLPATIVEVLPPEDWEPDDGTHVTFRGRAWFVADARWDETEGPGSHWHLTLTGPGEDQAPARPRHERPVAGGHRVSEPLGFPQVVPADPVPSPGTYRAASPTAGDPEPTAGWSDVVRIVEDSRATHVEWVEHLRLHTDCPDADVAGTREDHQEAIAGYDRVLAALTAVAALPEKWRAAARILETDRGLPNEIAAHEGAAAGLDQCADELDAALGTKETRP